METTPQLRSLMASHLGKQAKGTKKKLTAEQRETLRQRMVALNKSREEQGLRVKRLSA